MFRGTFNVVNNEGCKNWTCDGGLEIPPRLLCAILDVPPSTSKKQIHWLAERSDGQLDPSTEMCYKKMLLLHKNNKYFKQQFQSNTILQTNGVYK